MFRDLEGAVELERTVRSVDLEWKDRRCGDNEAEGGEGFMSRLGPAVISGDI